MATIEDCAVAIEGLLTAGLSVTSFGGQTMVGWPDEARLDAIVATTSPSPPLVSILPTLPAMNASRSIFTKHSRIAPESVPLVAIPQGNSIELSGAVGTNLNVHILGGKPVRDIVVQSTVEDAAGTLATFATKIATTVNAAAVPGFTMEANGAVLSAGGAMFKINIGTSTTAIREVGWMKQRLQISCWAPDVPTRTAMYSAVMGCIGRDDLPKVVLPDGTKFQCTRYSGPILTDYTPAQTLLKRADILYTVEYMLTYTETLTQVGAFTITTTSVPSGVDVVSVEG